MMTIQSAFIKTNIEAEQVRQSEASVVTATLVTVYNFAKSDSNTK